jgi:hypothetical protein
MSTDAILEIFITGEEGVLIARKDLKLKQLFHSEVRSGTTHP